MRTLKTSDDTYTYTSPQQCPKCCGSRTLPKDADKAFYQRIRGMDELSSFISKIRQDWVLVGSPVDKGKQEYKCTHCESTFTANDIKAHPYSLSYPSRCPHCQSHRTLPVAEEEKLRHYEPVWLIMELAEKEYKEMQTEEAKQVRLKKLISDSVL